MSSLQESIVVDVPVRTAYNQWTQFEDFPSFMKGIREVVQEDDEVVAFTAHVAGRNETWRARIVEQVPDHRITWRSVEGAENDGTVLFKALGPERTRVTLVLDYQPGNWLERAGDAMGVLQRRVEDDLRRFKEYIEQRGRASGGWRGEIHAGTRRR